MLIFKFAGSLRRFYRQIPLNVDTPAQGLRLLLAQNHEFKKAFLNTRLRIRIAGEDVEESAMQWHLDRHLKDGSVVLFVPVVEGAITAAAAAWIAVAVSVATETVQVTATWETATTTKKLVFELYVYTDDGKVVAQYETDQFRYEFFGLNAGGYTLGVRGRNENGMKGAETQISMVIGAPPAPSSVIWTPGLFSADLVPVMPITATTDTSFEFWYSGQNQIVNPNDIEGQTQFLGRSNQWTLHGLQADKTYYVYVRTKNAFGVSEFVEASGQASSDIPGMIELIDEQIRESDAFKNVQQGVNTNLDGIMSNALANHGTVEHQYQQYGEVRADILVVKTTVATAEQGLADLSTYVQAQIGPEGELTSAVNQKMTAEVNSDGTAKASYTLNMGIVRNGVKYNTGFGMSIEPDGSSYKSTVVFAADQFGIYSGSDPGNYTAAFFVYNGQVFIRDALIQDGSISNAKIGNYIQSNNFVAGSTGWRIDKNGNAELHGKFYADSGQFAFNGENNTVVINGNGVTVNLPGGGRVVVGRW